MNEVDERILKNVASDYENEAQVYESLVYAYRLGRISVSEENLKELGIK